MLLPLSAEYCSRGSLADVLKAARQSPSVAARLTWDKRLRMVSPSSSRPALALRSMQGPPLGLAAVVHCMPSCSAGAEGRVIGTRCLRGTGAAATYRSADMPCTLCTLRRPQLIDTASGMLYLQ